MDRVYGKRTIHLRSRVLCGIMGLGELMGMNKYDRLLHILNLLRSRRNLNAGMLASECGVTERSIYRDIIALSEANIPIYYDNGYKLASDNFLPPLNFDYDEYLGLKLAAESSPLVKTGKYGEALRKAMVKLDASVPESVRRETRFTPRTTHLDIPVADEQERGERFYAVVEEAASRQRQLRITYQSINSGESERIVEPYFIVFRGRAFYFVAFCRTREEIRTFRLDRVKDVELTTATFARRPGIAAETYFDGSWSVYSGEPIEVTVRFTGSAARVVSAGTHHAGEKIERIGDNEVIYRVETRGLEEIQRWILGFGGEAEVLEPPELRAQMRQTAEELRDTYGTAGDETQS